MARLIYILLGLAFVHGCNPKTGIYCWTSDDCASGNYCNDGTCSPCSPNIVGCPCQAVQGCATGLGCVEGKCAPMCNDGLWLRAAEECDPSDESSFSNGQCTDECQLFCDDGFGQSTNGCRDDLGTVTDHFLFEPEGGPTEEENLFLAGGRIGLESGTIWAGRFESTTVNYALDEVVEPQPRQVVFDPALVPSTAIVTANLEGFIAEAAALDGANVAVWSISQFPVPDSVGNVSAGEFATIRGPGVPMLTAVGGADDLDATAGLAGSTVWVSQIASLGLDRGFSAARLPDDGLVAGGAFCEGASSCNAQILTAAQTVNLASGASSDGYLIRYRSDGVVVWKHAIMGEGMERVLEVADLGELPDGSAGLVAALADYEGVTTVGGGVVQGARPSAFLAVYDRDSGGLRWVESLTSDSGTVRALGLAANKGPGGNVFALVHYAGELLVDGNAIEEGADASCPADENLAIVAFRIRPVKAEPLWARRVACGGFAFGSEVRPLADMTTADPPEVGDVLVVSALAGTSTFSPGAPNEQQLVMSEGDGSDVFIARFDGDQGHLMWVGRTEGAGAALGTAIVPLTDGVAYIGGGVQQADETFGASVVSTGVAFLARIEAN